MAGLGDVLMSQSQGFEHRKAVLSLVGWVVPCNLQQVGAELRIMRMGELALSLTSWNTQDSSPCTSHGQHNRAVPGYWEWGMQMSQPQEWEARRVVLPLVCWVV